MKNFIKSPLKIFRYFFLSLALLQVSLNSLSQEEVRITINATQVMNRINSTMYGSCIEDVNHEIYEGLYDQKIFGESFEEPSSGINYKDWRRYSGYWAAEKELIDGISIEPGRNTVRMVGIHPMSVEPDESSKLIYESIDLNNGSVEADIKFSGSKGENGGLLVRVSNPGIGTDVFDGYEISLNRDGKKIILVKHRRNFELLKEASVNVISDNWNKLRVDLQGPLIRVYLNGEVNPAIEYSDNNSPFLTGKIGLRTWKSTINFQNVVINSGAKTTKLQLTNPQNQHVSDKWDILQSNNADGQFLLLQENPFNGLNSQMIEFKNGKGRVGVANRSLNRWGIAVRKGQKFEGRVYLRSQDLNSPVTIALENLDGTKTYASQKIKSINSNWAKYPFTLTSNNNDSNTRFVIYIEGKGKIWIDQVVLMSTGEDQFKGLPLRADIGNAMISEGLTFLRYGGTMVNAEGYRFKKMIGDPDKLPPYTGHWNKYSTNGFGIEDFLKFCEAAGFEAAFAINIEETPEDAADMVEYLNGDISSIWGKKRAQNGHPKPYNVKYIAIGNEEVLFDGDKAEGYEHYIERFNLLYDSMRSKDAKLLFVNAAWWRPESPNMERVFRALNGKASYWDYHPWADDLKSGSTVDKELSIMRHKFKEWDSNTTMKCAIFEENGGLHNMQRALGHATILNATRRHGDFLLTSCPANALQPYLQNDNGWDQGQIFFTPAQVWEMPPFYAQQMAAKNHLPLRVRETVEGDLDVTATRSEDGKVLVLHVVNTDKSLKKASLILNGFSDRKTEVQIWTLAGELQAENTPENIDKILPKEAKATIPLTANIEYIFPANSYTILRFVK
jgi:alpha-L-arabinofuranosidase